MHKNINKPSGMLILYLQRILHDQRILTPVLLSVTQKKEKKNEHGTINTCFS